MAGKRGNSLETDRRIMQVAKYMLAGYSKRSFLFQIIAEKEDWQVSERQIDSYIKSAKQIIKNSNSDFDLKFEKDLAINRLEGLYAMNLKIQDFREARTVTMDRMKLMGLLVEKTDVNQKTEQTVIVLPSNERD